MQSFWKAKYKPASTSIVEYSSFYEYVKFEVILQKNDIFVNNRLIKI